MTFGHVNNHFPDLSLLIKNLKKLDTEIFLVTHIASQFKSTSNSIFKIQIEWMQFDYKLTRIHSLNYSHG